MQSEFSVRVDAASDLGSAPPSDDGVRQKIDLALAARRQRATRTEQGRLVAKTIETLRNAGRTRSLAARRPRPPSR